LAEQYRKTLGDDLTKQPGTEKRPAAKIDWGGRITEYIYWLAQLFENKYLIRILVLY
jgi:hypothetical protein